MSAIDLESSAAHDYFRALEDTLIRLRSSGVEVGPADYQVAAAWFEKGIPLAVVMRAMEETYARRRERNPRRKISSLRYFAPAVEAAWEEIQSLTATAQTVKREAIDPQPRLASLARALPEALPQREVWASRLLALSGSAAEIEDRLAELDQQLLDSLMIGLGETERAALAGSIERALHHLASRLASAELAVARERMLRQQLQRQLRLPVLSLFSAEAVGGVADETD